MCTGEAVAQGTTWIDHVKDNMLSLQDTLEHSRMQFFGQIVKPETGERRCSAALLQNWQKAHTTDLFTCSAAPQNQIQGLRHPRACV